MPVGDSHPADSIILPIDVPTRHVLEIELNAWWDDLDLRGKMWVSQLAYMAEKQHQARN